MSKVFYSSVLVLFSLLFFSGCGGGSSGDTIASNDVLEGTFVDSVVDGLEYNTTSGLSGITSNGGKFQYRVQDKIEFKIGKLSLGTAQPAFDGLVTPADLTDDNSTFVITLRLLQSLDADNNTSNGIVVPSDVLSDLEELSDVVYIRNVNSDELLLRLSNRLAEAIDEDYDGVIDVSAEIANQHYIQSMEMWREGVSTYYPGQNYTIGGTFDINLYPVSELTQDLKDALSHMGNEERLAYDLYMNLYNYHLQNSLVSIKQLLNVAQRSEESHIGIVQSLVRRYDLDPSQLSNVDENITDSYGMSNEISFGDMPSGIYDIPAIQDLYDVLFDKGIGSVQDALEVGCMVEVTDINDLDNYISLAEDANATDVKAAFEVLREGSYNHYWAFDKGLIRLGITEGCCSLGDDFCHTEYPH